MQKRRGKSKKEMGVVKSEQAKGLILVREMIITYSECMSIALFIQHEKRMRHVICDLSCCTIFSHYLINVKIFRGEKSYWI